MTDDDGESPQERPPAKWLSWWPSCGCLTYSFIGIVGLAFLALGPCDVPGFLELQTRTKWARARADTRSLATALEAYAIEHKTYPPSASGARGVNASAKPNDPASAIDTFAKNAETQKFLTALASRPETSPFDIFSASRKTYYGYYTNGQSWVLFSAGPDLVYDVTDPSRVPVAGDGDLDLQRFVDLTYDASNGTSSRGDILRFGGKAINPAREPVDPARVDRAVRLFTETPTSTRRP